MLIGNWLLSWQDYSLSRILSCCELRYIRCFVCAEATRKRERSEIRHESGKMSRSFITLVAWVMVIVGVFWQKRNKETCCSGKQLGTISPLYIVCKTSDFLSLLLTAIKFSVYHIELQKWRELIYSRSKVSFYRRGTTKKIRQQTSQGPLSMEILVISIRLHANFVTGNSFAILLRKSSRG